MAAPTSAVQKLQKILANVGPSTHGLLQAFMPTLFPVSLQRLARREGNAEEESRPRSAYFFPRASSHSSMIIAASWAGGRLSAFAMRTSSALSFGVNLIVSVSVFFSMGLRAPIVRIERKVYNAYIVFKAYE